MDCMTVSNSSEALDNGAKATVLAPIISPVAARLTAVTWQFGFSLAVIPAF